MSQAKVDRYKQEKANREKTMKKEKMIRRLEGADYMASLNDTEAE